MDQKRRKFLTLMGQSSTILRLSPLLLSTMSCSLVTPNQEPPFPPLKPTSKDDLVLTKGFNYDILIRAEDPINSTKTFGQNNDYIAFTPLKGSSTEALLWVNHEYLHPVLTHHRKMDRPRTRKEIIKEQQSVGGSILHIYKTTQGWKFKKDSIYNRRISGRTKIPFQKGYNIMGSTTALGTLANCAGGVTPWQTVLTCEENYDIFYGNVSFKNRERKFIKKEDELAWYKHFPQPPEHYGWVVEINPLTGKAVKRNALGRFAHEGATVVSGKDGIPVVYMGEDTKGGFIYKFISSKRGSLTHGTLYAADTINGKWLALDINANKKLKLHFKSQIEVLTHAHLAGSIVGATPQDRPEDIEVHPQTGDIFVTLTNNPKNNNYNGSILRLQETRSKFTSQTFKSQQWLNGGIQNGFACPDNLVFDNKGNLWMTVDMATEQIKQGLYDGLGNNGLFYVPMSGKNAGQAFQVASAPIDAELTGPCFSPDYKTLFLSVQHPGSETVDPKKPTSHWPNKKGLPKSSVVTISGPALNALTS